MASDFQVRVLYDFDSQPGSSELSIHADEILTVTRQDVGEGWWEGLNSRGETGLFPAEYVECMSTPEPMMPPPPLPADYSESDPIPMCDPSNAEPFNNLNHQSSAPFQSDPISTSVPAAHTSSFDDDWDSDWDDDGSSTTTAADHGQLSGSGNFGLSAPNRVIKSNSTGDLSSVGNATDIGGKGTVKKSMNRFSTFVKSGGEAFILGHTKLSIKDQAKIEILDTGESVIWSPNPEPYTCAVTSPKKGSKLKGLKSYISYTITPSYNSIAVSRRYKHFDWLHERLEEKFSVIPIPPLPDKQISGRYQEDFIEHRMIQLQLWVNRISRHPVLSQSDVWKHFVSCTDDKRWKQGKRKAEKDELIGAFFFLAVSPPATPISLSQIDEIDNFSRFVRYMDDSVKSLQTVVYDHSKKYVGGFQKEYAKVGNSFKGLAQAFEIHQSSYSNGLTNAIRHTSETYEAISRLYEEQPKYDLEPMADVLHEYKGMLASYPDILNLHKTALQKKKEHQKLAEEGKMQSQSYNDITHRTDVISYAVLSEINNFQEERVADFKYMMQCYLTEQIKFFQKITDKLHDTLEQYK